MSDADLLALYSSRILALAAGIPRLGRLPSPDATATRRAPLCGSSVTVDLTLRDGRVTDFAQEVRACALGSSRGVRGGPAASAAHRRTPPGPRRAARHAQGRRATAGRPRGTASRRCCPARDHPNRHGSILLALDATLDALERAR
jgi:NifU-like protein involved in Fe-S cluster formation